jgi:hypothetical protein
MIWALDMIKHDTFHEISSPVLQFCTSDEYTPFTAGVSWLDGWISTNRLLKVKFTIDLPERQHEIWTLLRETEWLANEEFFVSIQFNNF